MALFDTDHVPISAAESFRRVLGLLVIGNFIWLAWWLGVLEIWGLPVLQLAALSTFGVEFLVSRSWVRARLERRRPIEIGKWRTTRGARIATFWWLLVLTAFGSAVAAQARHAWAGGDMLRFAGGIGILAMLSVLLVLVTVRRLRPGLELAVDETGLFSRDWRGVVPWNAIDFVAAPNDTDETQKRLRLVIKPEAWSELPKFMRRRNASDLNLDLSLTATALSPAAAVDALHAARPDLEIRRPRSAGLVLPVRGATDIVEADL
jgi:hypothetical protein